MLGRNRIPPYERAVRRAEYAPKKSPAKLRAEIQSLALAFEIAEAEDRYDTECRQRYFKALRKP